MPQSVVIVGGGITGLSAAWALRDQNCPVTLIESGPFGGLLRTERILDSSGEFTVECGADSWLRTKQWLRNLAVDLGLGADIIPSDEAHRGTFILRNGTLTEYPRGLRLFAPTEWVPLLRTRLLGAGTKLCMLKELRRKPGSAGDRTVAEFVRDHFGEEAVEYLAEPLFAGVYGGTPEALGMAGVLPTLLEHERTYGSVIRGVRREPKLTGPLFETMRHGLSQIPNAIVDQLRNRVRLVRGAAESMEAGRVRVAGEWIGFDQAVIACGAPGASRLLSGTEAGALLGTIPHSSATIFVFGFDRAEAGAAPKGFGFLIPRRERRTVMAGTWINNKFPNRAPADRVLLRCFVAGSHDESGIPEVLSDIGRITKLAAKPLFSRVYRWPESLPQYVVGHGRRIEEIERLLPANIHVAGAFLRGVGMPDCAKCGIHAARMLPQTGVD